MMMMNGLKQKTDKVFSGRKVSSLIQVTCSVCVLNCNDYGAIKKEGRVSAQRSQHGHVSGPTRYNLRNPRPPLTHTLHVEWCVVWDSGEREGQQVEDYPWKEKASKQPAQQSPPFHITQQSEFRAHSDNAPEHHRVHAASWAVICRWVGVWV